MLRNLSCRASCRGTTRLANWRRATWWRAPSPASWSAQAAQRASISTSRTCEPTGTGALSQDLRYLHAVQHRPRRTDAAPSGRPLRHGRGTERLNGGLRCPVFSPRARQPAPAFTAPTDWPVTRCSKAWCMERAPPDAMRQQPDRPAHYTRPRAAGTKRHSPDKRLFPADQDKFIAKVQSLMWQYVGVVRDGKGLRQVIAELTSRSRTLPHRADRRAREARKHPGRRFADRALRPRSRREPRRSLPSRYSRSKTISVFASTPSCAATRIRFE